jgi:hypothetical protein
MDANRHPDTNVYFLECLIVSTDDTATTAATAGNGDFGTSPFFGGSQASHKLTCNSCSWRVGRQGARANREIRRRFIYLPSGRVSPVSIAKSEFRQIALYASKWPYAGPSAKPQTGREFLRRWRAALQGLRREASPRSPPLGGQFYTDSGRRMGAYLL